MLIFERYCYSCGEIFERPIVKQLTFEHPIAKQLIGKKTQHDDGSLITEKVENVLVSPCCNSTYYHASRRE